MTGWRPELVATDLDGTLLLPGGDVSARTVATIARLEAAGVPVVIVTGRPPRWLTQVAEQLDLHGIAVCANGALSFDLHTGTVIEADPLQPDILREVTTRLREAMPDTAFAVEYGDSFRHESGYEIRWAQDNPAVNVAELAEMLAQPAAKLLARHPSRKPDEMLAAAVDLLGDTVTITHSSSAGLLEISAAGVTKATGLAREAARHGVDARGVLAFGDMPNDLPMLAWAGRGVAVANAHPAVLEAADEVTGANTEDGVAAYLDRLFGSAVPSAAG